MTDPTSTGESRACATCGASFRLNSKYSSAQKARARFCSRRCAGRSQPHSHAPMIDLLGGRVRFGKLTFVGEGPPKGAMRRGLFRCDCGAEKAMGLHHIKGGRAVSCGCESAKRASARFTTHGGYRDYEYKSWGSMIQRCTNPRSTSFADYGGRGISVCPQWQGEDGYRQFVADMGPRPKGMTLDRIDGNGNYEPGNTRWATPKRQQNNRRCSKFLTLGDVTRTQREWTDALGWGKNVISERLRAGWTVQRALTTPVSPHRRKAS